MTTRKIQFTIRPAGPPGDGLDLAVQHELAPALLRLRPERLTISCTAKAPPALSVIPFQRWPLVLVSIWDAGTPVERWSEALRALPGLVAGYQVSESLPVRCTRDWPLGQRTPGAGLLTLLNRRRGLNDEAFFRAWHGRHTPLSLEVHPLWSYVRNVVERTLLPGSPPFDGIVEEHFRTSEDLLRPDRFFGGPWRMIPNMIRVGLDIRRFLDLRRLETYLVDEYRFTG